MNKREASRRSRQRGSALIEFVLAFALFWIPLFFGTLVIGFNLIRAVQVTQVCRDAGHMYSQGIDFSQAVYQNLLVSLASGLNMTSTGGNGVVVLSTLTYIDDAQCQSGGYAPGGTCPNYQKVVITRRVWVGNSGLHTSSFGTLLPNSALLDAAGNVTLGTNTGTRGYLNDPSTVATGFSSVIPLVSGQLSYVSEMYIKSPDLDWWAFLGNMDVSARSIF